LENTSIRNPIAGIRAYHKRLEEVLADMHETTIVLREKAEEFNKRVLAYYQSYPFIDHQC